MKVCKEKDFKKLTDGQLSTHLTAIKAARAEFPMRFRWMLLSRRGDALIEKLKAGTDRLNEFLSVIAPASKVAAPEDFDPLLPTASTMGFECTQVKILTWLNEKAISSLILPSMLLEGQRQSLVYGISKGLIEPLEGLMSGEIEDSAALMLGELCQAMRSLCALSSDSLSDIAAGLDDLALMKEMKVKAARSPLADVKMAVDNSNGDRGM